MFACATGTWDESDRLRYESLALGVESLERFVSNQPLRKVHECVFAVLAKSVEKLGHLQASLLIRDCELVRFTQESHDKLRCS